MLKNTENIILDELVFEQLFKTHFQHLFNFAFQYLPDEDIAKDITQNVFVKLWEHRTSIDTQKSVQSYLFTSVRNSCINHIRDHKKYNSRILDVELAEIESGIKTDNYEYIELEQKINKILGSLPEKCRKVFEMSRFENKKYKEIAIELDISEKTVEAHMSKALKSLKEHLREYLISVLLILLTKFVG
jgi:RNA polymerase sigma-70 factor, ECF subfamily